MIPLKEIREAKKLTQRQLSEKTGIETSHISEYENGHKLMREDTIRRFAEALNVSPGEIMGDKPRRKK